MRIFISYSKNREAVRVLAADLGHLGHQVWYDQQLSGGHAWWNDILNNIRQADLFVCALTAQWLASEPSRREFEYARRLNKRILPVLLADVDMALVPPAVSELQYVDYRQRSPDAAFALSTAISGLPPISPLPDPLPPPPTVPLSPLARIMERIESADELAYQEQAALVLDLKGFLRQPATADHARQLLRQLRERPDILANIDHQIGELLAPANQIPWRKVGVGVAALALILALVFGISKIISGVPTPEPTTDAGSNGSNSGAATETPQPTETPAPTEGDAIEILSVSPPVTQELASGIPVSIEVHVRYRIGSPGDVHLNVWLERFNDAQCTEFFAAGGAGALDSSANSTGLSERSNEDYSLSTGAATVSGPYLGVRAELQSGDKSLAADTFNRPHCYKVRE